MGGSKRLRAPALLTRRLSQEPAAYQASDCNWPKLSRFHVVGFARLGVFSLQIVWAFASTQRRQATSGAPATALTEAYAFPFDVCFVLADALFDFGAVAALAFFRNAAFGFDFLAFVAGLLPGAPENSYAS